MFSACNFNRKMRKREFLKIAGFSGLGLVGADVAVNAETLKPSPHHNSPDRKQYFNMSGYAAPKIDTIRVG
jgi:hypothetical protein